MLKLLKNLSPKQWLMICLSVVLIVGQVYLDLKLPDYMTEITTLIQMPNPEMKKIWISGGYMLGCALSSAFLSVAVGFLAAKVAAKLGFTLRHKVFSKVQSYSKSEINKFSTASLITRSTNDVTQVQMIVSLGLQAIFKAPILAVWAIVKILGKSWQFSLITAAAVIVLLVTIVSVIVICMPKFKVMQSQTDDLNRVTRENLTGLKVVKAFNAESFEESKFDKANGKLTNTIMFVNKRLAFLEPIMQFVMSTISIAIYWVGAYLLNNASNVEKIGLLSDMVVFMSYAVYVILAFMLLVMIFMMFPRASVSAKRINEILNTNSSISDGVGARPIEVGTVEFKNVSFKYADASENVLENISFKVNSGETVAFIGSTGSGKSTLIDLIPRFFDATSGEVLVDGVNVKEYKQEELHNIVGYVSQKSILFSGSVNKNVSLGMSKFGKPTNEDVKNAISLAQAKDFVENMEQGYETNISQSGKNVSGGQKQRLSIARAFARKAEIYIFDDSFSALDYKTDKNLRDVLKKELKGVTTLIVAQRIGSIREADKIIVLDEGKIVGQGKHEELLKSCPLYKEIALSQLSEEEL